MASLSPDIIPHDDQTALMVIRKPVMLKDYLLNDLSSCSSNGFQSFPRRQCCITVRFLLEIDLKKKSSDHHQKLKKGHHDRDQWLWRSRSRSSSAISALQRASDAVINAVKHLPFLFPSIKKGSSSSSILPISLSRKILRNRLIFWGKSDQKINNHIRRSRLTSSDQVLYERCEPSDQNTITPTAPTVVTASTSSNSWGESEFANSHMLSSTENDVVESEKDLSSQKVNNNKVDITVGEDLTEAATTAKEWSNEEEKEQFSPVSVLDCPYQDDDHDETSSPFHHKLARLEGNKQKLVQKIPRFENLTQLEPVDLEKRIAMSELEDKLVTISNKHRANDHERRNESEEKAREMMKLIKIRTSTTTTLSTPLKIDNLVSKVDNLLFDFFRERVMEDFKANQEEFNEKEALKLAEDWVNGETREVLLGWEVKEARNTYVKDMQKSGRWRKMDEEKNEIGLELEFQLWDSLVQELLLDLL